MDTAQIIQTLFATATVTGLLFCKSPILRRYLSYGPRRITDGTKSATDTTSPTGAKQDTKPMGTSIYRLLDKLITYPVPHAYFTHFYIFSVMSSLFWGYQILTQGSLLQSVARFGSPGRGKGSMSAEQVVLAWSLMTAQGMRRLIETMTLGKKSASTMQFSHYLVGFLHYLGVGIAIWIEGSETILSDGPILKRLTLPAPSLKTMINLPIFIFASGVQHDCHVYLASLAKYTLPMVPPFRSIISPHYTAECLIYGALTFLAAPQGTLVNKTFLTIFVWVVCNLAFTAYSNKSWYAEKFGKEKVADRWIMIPLIW